MKLVDLRLFVLALSVVCLQVAVPAAYGDLATLDNPGGGQIVYGPISGQSSLAQAMGYMLRQVHGHFGDRPQVGRFFRANGSNSVATFFTLTAKAQGGKQLAGMVIVTMPQDGSPAGAVLYDQADHFSASMTPMLKKLNEVWQPMAASTKGPGDSGDPLIPAHSGPPQPLRSAPFSDGSGSIGLPAGWRIVQAGGGAVSATGPNGELVNLGLSQQICDPTTPQGQQMIQYARNVSPSNFDVAPYGGDLYRTFLAVTQQNSQRTHTPVPTFKVTASKRLQASPYEAAAILVLADADTHDGKEPLVTQLRISALQRVGPAYWSMNLNQVAVPKRLVDQEWATLGAIVASWQQNGAVIQQQTQTVVNGIHAIGERSKQAAADADVARENLRSSYEARSNAQDKASQNFSNYMLDQTVVQNTQTGEHSTVWNQYADSLVKNAPDRYQYVPSQDMMKGIDY